jgi:hypothetical protein
MSTHVAAAPHELLCMLSACKCCALVLLDGIIAEWEMRLSVTLVPSNQLVRALWMSLNQRWMSATASQPADLPIA